VSNVQLLGQRHWALLPKKKGPVVVLLHGGLSSSASLLRVLRKPLERHFRVAAFDRRGHGRTADTPAPFSYDAMADETIAFIELLGRRVHLLGHSDGAIVALLVARRRPDLVRRAVVVGANFNVAGLMPITLLTPGSPWFSEFAAKYAEQSPDGIDHAAVVVEKFNHLISTEPSLTTSDLREVNVPVLVLVGDDDVIRHDHTVELYESLPQGQLGVIPGTSHAVLKEKTALCVRVIDDFLRGPAVPVTREPIRRARTT